MEAHLSHCDVCQKTLHRIAGDGCWWDDVREAMQETSMRSSTSKADSSEYHEFTELLESTDNLKTLGRIGPYEVEGIFGRGGVGAVFKAYESAFNGFVAIRLQLSHLAATGAAGARFQREGQAVAFVVHDHVLPIYVLDAW